MQDCAVVSTDASSLRFANVDALRDALAAERYLADLPLCTALFVALELGTPLLLEGEAGVGKTELAKALAGAGAARA